jgi:hypothetical protein
MGAPLLAAFARSADFYAQMNQALFVFYFTTSVKLPCWASDPAVALTVMV